MQRAVRCLAVTCLFASLAVLPAFAESSQTIWVVPPDDAKATGSLIVDIKPVAARRDGARWRVDGGPWQKSGDTVSSLDVGKHKVTFKTIADWQTPEEEKASIRGRQTTELVVTYVETETELITLPGGVPLEFVWIPAGSFMMGRTMNGRTGEYEEESVEDEDPRHRVTFANGFWMGKYEVTQAQWVAVMGSNPSYNTGDLSRPVEVVSWNTIQTFITAVNALGQGSVHLPTEAQWEYACRAGTTTRFYWGNDPNYTQLGTYEWYYDNSSSTSHPVGQKRPNPWGLYDMGGNVVEWCEDVWHSDYTGAPTDGSAWVLPAGFDRVVRAGGYQRYNGACRSANRYLYGQTTTTGDLGFRLAMRSVPVAAFSAAPTSGPAPLEVQFTDESAQGTLPNTYWEWDFNNDGTVDSTEQNPQTTFQDAGLYDVKLTVGSASGSNSLTKNDSIVVVPSEDYDVIMLPGDVPLEMHWIPAGSFMMGQNTNEQDSELDESPQHQVTLANGFWMGKYEVTQAQWVAVMGGNPSYFTGDLSRPVEKVSWDAVQTFITAVNALGQGAVYLPTEAQWEYACRAGSTTRFYWGDDLSYSLIGNYAWYDGNAAFTGTNPVGQKLPNAWGLYDMSGNVSEWCKDWYHSSYEGAPANGSAWVSPVGSYRARRGGVWGNSGNFCRSANRGYSAPSEASIIIGFRLARYSLSEVVGPTAAFNATPTWGRAPLVVQFTDESTPGSSPITSWAWDFNTDGVVDSTEQNPQPIFQDAGPYDVTLTVGSVSGSDSLTKNDYIGVTQIIMLPGDVPLEMHWIPAGSFLMGRYTNEQESSSDEGPQHQVTLADGFWMGKYEVTQAQWVAVMGSNPSQFTGNLSRPVEKVSWDAIHTFIGAVNALGQGTVHLPTEAQWEYACRAGTTTRFYWGDDPSYSNIGNYAWYRDNSDNTTHPVGKKTPNVWGLFDMSGNVWEWCEDWYHSSYVEAPTDGSAWVSPTGSSRVQRGGNAYSVGKRCRSAIRSYAIPSSASSSTGFRVAGYFPFVAGPTAAFSATPTSGLAPLEVQFTDESTPGGSPITSWAWDFNNDGTVDSTEQNPAHTYSSAGVYDVALTVSRLSGSDMLTKQALIEVLSVVGPTAAFSADPTSGLAPLEVQFTDESMPGLSPITSWEWDFENDGVVDSTEQNPAHTYETVGDYDVKLSVFSSSGSNALTQEALIEVLPVVGPTAAFSATPTSGLAPLYVQFTDESMPGTSPITSWAWDFENDGVVDSTEQNPITTFEDLGTYDVKVTVGSASGSDSLTKNDFINATSSIMLPGEVPLEMVWIPAGSFMMGRYADEQDSLDIEDPQHQVTFANGFWIGKYEVTLAQWLAVMGQNPNYFTGDLNRPVERVSWETIQTFIGAVNALGQGTVHLPSEAQWEYACRAGTTTRLYWGDDLSYTDLGTYAWHSGNSASTTHPVGQKTPNALGLYDMSGNVWEWCEDWYHSSYTGAPTDGSAWVSPTGSVRVIRGGSWDSTGINHRSAFRSYSTPASAFNDIGFRLAR